MGAVALLSSLNLVKLDLPTAVSDLAAVSSSASAVSSSHPASSAAAAPLAGAQISDADVRAGLLTANAPDACNLKGQTFQVGHAFGSGEGSRVRMWLQTSDAQQTDVSVIAASDLVLARGGVIGDGRQDVAVAFNCTSGISIQDGPYLALYRVGDDGGLTLAGFLPVTTADSGNNTGAAEVQSITIVNGTVEIKWNQSSGGKVSPFSAQVKWVNGGLLVQ